MKPYIKAVSVFPEPDTNMAIFGQVVSWLLVTRPLGHGWFHLHPC